MLQAREYDLTEKCENRVPNNVTEKRENTVSNNPTEKLENKIPNNAFCFTIGDNVFPRICQS